MDVADLDACVQGSVEGVRELLELATLPPAGSRFRVLIIDQAHMLSPMATNALLGTVEEPPDRTVIIFTTDKPDRLPSALRSRMLHYRLRLVAPTAVNLRLIAPPLRDLEGARRNRFHGFCYRSNDLARRNLTSFHSRCSLVFGGLRVGPPCTAPIPCGRS